MKIAEDLFTYDWRSGEHSVTPDQIEEYAQQRSIEFTEWMAINGKPVTKYGLIEHWKLKSYQSKDRYTTSELFDKFMEERSAQ